MEATSWTSQGIVEDTRRGLLDEPKWLSSLYFYDEQGSRLFDAITTTREYYPTRTEHAILERHAGDILDAVQTPLVLAELGSGASLKTRTLLAALLDRQDTADYLPVDVSADFLADVAAGLTATFPGLAVHPIAGEYAQGLAAIGAHPAPRRLVLFLGSSIGNFEPEEQASLLQNAHDALSPGDAFLLGTDLVKDPKILEAAYNDAEGQTARFNKNILHHLNARLGGENDVEAFEHTASWKPEASRIEMHLRAKRPITLRFPAAELEIDLVEGETIHTENSYKFTIDGARALAADAGFTPGPTWTDPDDWFALHLLRV